MWLALTALLVTNAPLAAQQPATTPVSAERLFADSLFAQLNQARSVAALLFARCASQSPTRRQLCENLVALRRSELTGLNVDILAANRLAARMILDQPRSPVAWYALGISRLQLAASHAIASEGPLQPIGVSNEAAAGYALIHALELDATLQVAAEALALGALPPAREGASRLHERVAMLRRVRDILSPDALYGAGRVETIAGDPDSAVTDFRMALAHGVSAPGNVDLALARAEYKAGHAVDGRVAFLAGSSDTSTRSKKGYREHVAWVASPAELAGWDSLPDAQRPEWLARFWARRDVAGGRGDGARLVEHFARYETALKLYPVIIPYAGIQRNAQDEEMFGEVGDSIRAGQHSGATGDSAVRIFDRLQAFDANSRTYGTSRPFRFVPILQDILDDRGMVYMRHGKPDEVASGHATAPIAPQGGGTRRAVPEVEMEIWKYNLADGPLTLQFKQQHFSGTINASVLVPTLITGNAETRSQICNLDPTICPRAETTVKEINFGMMTTARVQNAYGEGVEEIRRATTTDHDALKFTSAVHPSVELYSLRHADGQQNIVISYALPGAELLGSPLAAGVLYPVTFHLRAADSTGRRFDIDTTRNLLAHEVLAKNTFLTGVVDMPVPPGVYDVSLTVTQPDGRGATASFANVRVAPSINSLAISDLVLGNAASGARWNSGAGTIPLNPLNTFPGGASAEAYIQITGLISGQPYTTTFDVFRADDAAGHTPRISVRATQLASTANVALSRTLALRELSPGRYRVALTVTSGEIIRSSAAFLTIVK